MKINRKIVILIIMLPAHSESDSIGFDL